MIQSVRGLADDVVREFDRPDGHQPTSSDQTQENSDDEEFEEASWDGETFDADTDWTAVDKLAGNNRDSYPAAESVTFSLEFINILYAIYVKFFFKRWEDKRNVENVKNVSK